MRSRFVAALLLLLLPSVLAAQYQPALPGYKYEFPRDHFDHPDYKTEWWYYTGNLKSADGHRFGFELTFFRQAVSRDGALKGDCVLAVLRIPSLPILRSPLVERK